MDSVWDLLVQRIRDRAEYFKVFDRFRLRPDAWLKVEVLATLSELERSGSVHHLRPDRQGCDVSFTAGEDECWLAVKGLITSYAGNARDVRSTLVSVEEISKELDKLRGLATLSGGKPALVLAAFPFGPEPRERNEWQSQLLRFEAKGFAPTRDLTMDLPQSRTARIWIFA
jgi:hypothetical protein